MVRRKKAAGSMNARLNSFMTDHDQGQAGGGQYGTEPIWYRPIMVQARYFAMLNYIFGTTMKSSVKWC